MEVVRLPAFIVFLPAGDDGLSIRGAFNIFLLLAISFGSEKPRATGHDEEAWQQNRRADLAAIPATYKK